MPKLVCHFDGSERVEPLTRTSSLLGLHPARTASPGPSRKISRRCLPTVPGEDRIEGHVSTEAAWNATLSGWRRAHAAGDPRGAVERRDDALRRGGDCSKEGFLA